MNMKRSRPKLTSPLLPIGVDIIIPPPPYEACSFIDKLLVYASSLVVVGSPLWFYYGIIYIYKKWKQYLKLSKGGNSINANDSDNKGSNSNYTSSGESSSERQEHDNIHTTQSQRNKYKQLATKYGTALTIMLILSIWGPHRNKRIGEWLNVRQWRLWDAWLNYVGFTVLHDRGDDAGNSAATNSNSNNHQQEFDPMNDPAMYAFVPHGIFPFGLAFSCLPQRGYENTWGLFRPVVATATRLFPLVRTFIAWMGGVDASRNAVSSALSEPGGSSSRRLGISPGGIAEMFETFPKSGYHKNDEAALLKDRNGLFKLAVKHNIPVIPVYCFGATKMFRRVQLPYFLETLSRALRISLCILYGKMGLPVPFRQRLMYVIGRTIWPSISNNGVDADFDDQVKQMHKAFCKEIIRVFDRNKEHYGWKDKTLRLV